MTRTTIADVAKAAGVSVSTVSRALRGLDRVNPETRERVEKEANRLHFSFSKSASSLASGKTMRIAVLLPSEISSWFNSHAFEGIYEVMSKADYDVVPYIVWTQEDLDRFFQNLPGNRNVDAIIEASFDFDEAKKRVLGELTIPVVGMNAPSTHGLDAGVAIDDAAAMSAIVRFLKSLGHKTLAYIGQPVNASPFICSDIVREKGFLDAAKECGYGDDDIIIVPSLTHMDVQNEQDIYSGIVAQLLSAPKQPTGICVSVDAAAVPLLKELRRMGWHVPQDVSVVGFDDDPSASIVDMTTMHQNPTEIGRIAARKTLALLAGGGLEEQVSDNSFCRCWQARPWRNRSPSYPLPLCYEAPRNACIDCPNFPKSCRRGPYPARTVPLTNRRPTSGGATCENCPIARRPQPRTWPSEAAPRENRPIIRRPRPQPLLS